MSSGKEHMCDVVPLSESKQLQQLGTCNTGPYGGNNDAITGETLSGNPVIFECGPTGKQKVNTFCYNESTIRRMMSDNTLKDTDPYKSGELTAQAKNELRNRLNIVPAPSLSPMQQPNIFNMQSSNPFVGSPFNGSSLMGNPFSGIPLTQSASRSNRLRRPRSVLFTHKIPQSYETQSPFIPSNLSENKLFTAVVKDSLADVKQYIREGKSLNVRDENGNSALMMAIIYKRPRMIAFLISQGVSVNSKNFDGITPLMIASYANMPNVVKFLLEEGANKGDTDVEGRRAYDYTEMNEIKNMVRTRANPKPKTRGKKKATKRRAKSKKSRSSKSRSKSKKSRSKSKRKYTIKL